VPATSIETAKPLPLKTRIGYQLAALRGFFDEWELGYKSTSGATAPRLGASKG
jgi:hypothetical protein